MPKLFLYYLTVVILHRVLGSPGWLSIHDPPALTSWMLGLQVYTAMPGSPVFLTEWLTVHVLLAISSKVFRIGARQIKGEEQSFSSLFDGTLDPLKFRHWVIGELLPT